MEGDVPVWLHDLAPPAGQRWSKEASRAGLARAEQMHREKRDLINRCWSNREALIRINPEHHELGQLDIEEAAAARWLEHYSAWRDALQMNIEAHELEEKAARAAMTQRPHNHVFERKWRDQLYAGEECTLCTTRRLVSVHNADVEMNAGTVAHQRWLDGGPVPGDPSGVKSRPVSDYGGWR